MVLQNLLEVVHDLFEEQTSIDKVIMKIMQRAQRLLKCERAAVLLVDESCDSTTFSRLFDLNSPKHTKNNVKKLGETGRVIQLGTFYWLRCVRQFQAKGGGRERVPVLGEPGREGGLFGGGAEHQWSRMHRRNSGLRHQLTLGHAHQKQKRPDYR